MPKAKPIYASKAMLLGVVTILAALAQSRFGWGWVIDADVQLALVGVLVVIVRYVTKDGVRFREEKPALDAKVCPTCHLLERFHEKGKPCPYGITPNDRPEA
jgi:hypothetical protein